MTTDLNRMEASVPTADKNRPAMPMRKQRLSGWGRYPVIEGLTYRPEAQRDLDDVVRHTNKHEVPNAQLNTSSNAQIIASQNTKLSTSLIPRGAGRSYGDAAANPKGITVLMERLNRILSFDESTGVVRVESGVLIKDLIDVFAPRGYMPPVVPGTKYVTIGGAIAADVHGKNHYSAGSFSRHLKGFELIDGTGVRRWCARQENSEAFWATVGGMGLTGIITEAEISLTKITSMFMKSRCVHLHGLKALLEAFEENVSNHQYAVAWLDCSGNKMSRMSHIKSVLFLGDHAEHNDHADEKELSMPNAAQGKEFRAAPHGLFSVVPITIPDVIPPGFLNPRTLRLFNQVYFFLQRRKHQTIQDLDRFFFPLDSVNDWNRLYGHAGFVQYQCLLPCYSRAGGADTIVRDSDMSSNQTVGSKMVENQVVANRVVERIAEGITEILSHCAESGHHPWLVVLKRFGKTEEHSSETHKNISLSFPDEGYTLTMDFPRRVRLPQLINNLDTATLQMGGRVYLAKDSCLTLQTFQQMYPQWRQWLTVRDELDPGNIFSSALSTRLGLTR